VFEGGGRVKKFLITIAVVIVLIAGGLVIARNILARQIIIKGIKAVTGMAVDIKSINIGLVHSGISVSGLKIYNPEGFNDKLLADCPEVYCDFDLPGLFRNRVHLSQLRIDINELDIILNAGGKLNVNSLALFLPKPGGGISPEVKIDELRLKLGKVIYKGYFPAVGVKEGTFNIDIEEQFHDVTDPTRVAKDILKKILNRIGIADLANFDLKAQATQMKEQAQLAANEVMQKAKEDLKGILSK